MSVSPVWWNEKAKYYFSRAHTLFIGLDGQVIIRIDPGLELMLLSGQEHRLAGASASPSA